MSDRNLNPHAEARVAMAIWSHEYAYEQKGGSMDFWDSRTPSQKATCVKFVNDIRDLPRADGTPSPVDHVVAVVSVKTMRLSDGRADYFVSIKVGKREVTPHVFREEYKAAYHVALYSWLLNGTPKPNLMAFDEGDWPAQATEIIPDVEAEIASVVQSVNEWDDRTSPDEYPEHLLITSEELADILRNFAATLASPLEGSANV